MMEKLVKFIKLFEKETGTPLEYFNTYTHCWNNVNLTSKYSISQFLRKRNYNGFLTWLDKNNFIDYNKVHKELGFNIRLSCVSHLVEYSNTKEYQDTGINLLISILK